MHPYRCVVFIFCNLLKYYFFDKGVCFPFPLLLAVPQYTSLCKCLCIPIYCYSLDKFFMMKLLGKVIHMNIFGAHCLWQICY